VNSLVSRHRLVEEREIERIFSTERNPRWQRRGRMRREV
jgi:hypothetical protein